MGAHILVTPVHSSFKFSFQSCVSGGISASTPSKAGSSPCTPNLLALCGRHQCGRDPASGRSAQCRPWGQTWRAFPCFLGLLGTGCLRPLPSPAWGREACRSHCPCGLSPSQVPEPWRRNVLTYLSGSTPFQPWENGQVRFREDPELDPLCCPSNAALGEVGGGRGQRAHLWTLNPQLTLMS